MQGRKWSHLREQPGNQAAVCGAKHTTNCSVSVGARWGTVCLSLWHCLLHPRSHVVCFVGKDLLCSLLPHLQDLHFEDLCVALMWCTYFLFWLTSREKKYKENPVRYNWTKFGWGLFNFSDKFFLLSVVCPHMFSFSIPFLQGGQNLCPGTASICAIGWLQQKIKLFEPQPKFLVRRATDPSGSPCTFPFKTQEWSWML